VYQITEERRLELIVQREAALQVVFGPAPPPMRPEEVVPRGQDFATQGHLYRSIELGFVRPAGKLGEVAAVSGALGRRASDLMAHVEAV